MITVILDNEAVCALQDPHHPHHREVLGYIEANRGSRRTMKDRQTVVPTSVRVEAGWDRTAASASAVNQLAIVDGPLDGAAANAAARIRLAHGVSVADAHIGALIQMATLGDVTVLTSDAGDVQNVAERHAVNVIQL